MNYFEEIMNGNFDPSTDEVVMEAYYPENIPYMKTTHKFITLPQGTPIGKGNLCLLYTKDQDESIKVIKNTLYRKISIDITITILCIEVLSIIEDSNLKN